MRVQRVLFGRFTVTGNIPTVYAVTNNEHCVKNNAKCSEISTNPKPITECNPNPLRGDRAHVYVHFNGKHRPIKGLLDSGASTSLLSPASLEEIRKHGAIIH